MKENQNRKHQTTRVPNRIVIIARPNVIIISILCCRIYSVFFFHLVIITMTIVVVIDFNRLFNTSVRVYFFFFIFASHNSIVPLKYIYESQTLETMLTIILFTYSKSFSRFTFCRRMHVLFHLFHFIFLCALNEIYNV